MLTHRNSLFCGALSLALILGIQSQPQAADFDPVHTPDKHAWDLFIELNHPADSANAGEPDPDKKLGEPGETVWETWALAKRDVFTQNGCHPAKWGAWMGKALVATPLPRDPVSKVDLIFSVLQPDEGVRLFFDPTEPFSETRMNRAAFDFIIDNGLYTIEGQEKFHTEGRAIDLPVDGKEIKSAWRLLTNEEAKSGRFHTQMTSDGNTFGLIALHIITKELPQWFWATFEHVDNPDIDVRNLDSDIRWVDSYTDGGEAAKLPTEIRETKWENYRLKGTQTEFVTLDGRPTILANAIIERGFMGSSSCISCHAHASIGNPDENLGSGANRRANRLPIFKDIRTQALNPTDPNSKRARYIVGWTGVPEPALFYDRNPGSLLSPTRKYTQTDFMWSFFRAESEKKCQQ
jgi:hypothetical protein